MSPADRKLLVIKTGKEAIDDALFEQPLQPPLGSQFGHVAISALVERARARIARAIHIAFRHPSRRFRAWLAAS